MDRRTFLANSGMAAAGTATLPYALTGCSQGTPVRQPNIVVLFADDMGYGDWEGGGHPTVRTPNLVNMAREGVSMPQFYATCPYCSPSRASLLTGRHFVRTGVIRVFFPGDERGLPNGEITMAAALKDAGYTTACIGKWHLGGEPEYRPDRYGFDHYYGLMHSNNMFDFRLFENGTIIEDPVDQTTLTRRYTEQALSFMERAADQPFFIYLPYTMPHVPVYASEQFAGESRNGDYGDAVEEIDWSVGELLNGLDRLGFSDNTLVVFTSDNGPASYKTVPRGTSGLLTGCKGDTWEGGMRVPFIARFPGRIPADTVCRSVGNLYDLFPTCLRLAGVEQPTDRPYDGIDLAPVWQGEDDPERTIYYYMGDELRAIRQGKWKLHFTITRYPEGKYHLGTRFAETLAEPLLFDLEHDPSEQYDVAAGNPGIVTDLTARAAAYRDEIARNGENSDLIDWFNTDGPGKGPKTLTGKD